MAAGGLSAGAGRIASWTVVRQRKGWIGHVLAFGFAPDVGAWLVIDPRWDRIDVMVMGPAAFDRWRAAECAGCPQLRIDANRGTSLLSPGLWCVGVVKRLVGLRSGAFTPAALWRDLKAAGAREVCISHEGQAARRDAGGEGSTRRPA